MRTRDLFRFLNHRWLILKEYEGFLGNTIITVENKIEQLDRELFKNIFNCSELDHSKYIGQKQILDKEILELKNQIVECNAGKVLRLLEDYNRLLDEKRQLDQDFKCRDELEVLKVE